MGTRTVVEDETVIAQVPPLPAKETVVEQSEKAVNESIERVDSYVAPPVVSQSQVMVFGSILFVLSLIWPPLVLLVAYMASILIPYSYRITDEPSRRRQLLTEFENGDLASSHLLKIPKNVNIEQSYWTNKRGFLLHTSIMTPKDQPIKAVVCYCHGYSDTPSYTKRRELTRIVQEGIAIVMIDYEGHGRSDGPLCLVVDWDLLVDDVASYFKEISVTRFLGKRIFLMGESMGGAVAYCIYNKMPGVFAGVNFICPMCKISDDMLPPQWVIDLARIFAGPKGQASLFGYLPISPAGGDLKKFSYKLPERRALMTRVPSVFGRNPRLATARELIDITKKISSSLADFEAPFLIQHGKDDKITDPKLSQALYDESKSKDKTLRLYDGMWHCITNGEPEDNIEMVLKDSIDWILARAGSDTTNLRKSY